MAQITIYLPDELETKARRVAKGKRQSVSRWIAEQVAGALEDGWPKGVMRAAGAFPDFPSAVEIRRGQGKDAAREPLE